MKYFLHCWLFNFSFLVSLNALGSDSTIRVENNEFLEKIISSKGYIYSYAGAPSCILPFKEAIFSEKGQELYKTPKNLYVRLHGTGFLYKMVSHNDSIVEFTRIDQTVNFNFNIGAYSFSAGEELYNYGGYGFWKNNGTIRRYNFKTSDWVAEASNQEVINQFSPISNAWFDPTEEKLYVPFETVVNDGLIGNVPRKGKVDENSHVLDLKTLKWQNIGKANQQVVEIMLNSELGISTHRGLLVLYHEKLYLIDFKSNKLFHLKDNMIAQTVFKMDKGQLLFHQGKLLHVYNPRTKKSDSIPMDLAKFSALPNAVIETNNDFTILAISSICLIGLIIFFSRKKRSKKLAKQRDEISKNDFKINFSETETALISMLIAKSKINQTATIEEINYTLGVKNKNIGMQKKTRSDVFKSINEKYTIFSSSDEILIKSIRSLSDKRYFEYMIDEEMIESVTGFLGAKIQKQ